MSDARQSAACGPQADRNLTPIATLIEDPARSAMLAALAGGRALPAGELARRAGVQPGAASVHLRRLTEAGLIRVRVQGRHRYHEIVDPEVATVLEAIAQIAPPAPVRSLPQQHAACALSDARTCYDHLAGRRGVDLRDRHQASCVVGASDCENVVRCEAIVSFSINSRRYLTWHVSSRPSPARARAH